MSSSCESDCVPFAIVGNQSGHFRAGHMFVIVAISLIFIFIKPFKGLTY